VMIMPETSEYPTANDVLALFRFQYSYIPVQTYEQAQNNQFTDPAYVPYNFFVMLYELAVDEFSYDLLGRGGIKATWSQTRAALAHLIADYCEKSNPDWAYRRQRVDPGSGLPVIDIERRDNTGPREAYEQLLDVITSAGLRAAGPYNGSSNAEPFFTRDMPLGVTRWLRSGFSIDDWRKHKEIG
ncbi:MAG TPA: hypothetical protein PK659_10175, partial [Methanothrix sp.]